MGLFSKLFGGRKDEEMPVPVEVCQVVMDEIESREKSDGLKGESELVED